MDNGSLKTKIANMQNRLELISTFHQACKEDNVEIISFIVTQTSVGSSSTIMSQGLAIACENNNLQLMYDLVSTNVLSLADIFTASCKAKSPEAIKFIVDNINLSDEVSVKQALLSIVKGGNPQLLENFQQRYNTGFMASMFDNYINEALNSNAGEMVNYLLKTSSNYAQTSHYTQAQMDELFIKAALKGNLETMKYMLTSPELSVNANIHTHGDAALIISCDNGHLDNVKYLLTSNDLKEHADISADGHAALLIAAQREHNEIVKYLLSSNDLTIKADIHADDDQVLYQAIEDKNIELIKFILTSPEISEHANAHSRNDNLFMEAYEDKYDYEEDPEMESDPELLDYLIEEYKINMTQDIENFLTQKGDPHYILNALKNIQTYERLSNLPEKESVKRPKI